MSPTAARNIEKRLKTHIIGQDEAVRAVSLAVRRASAGVMNPDRSVASFLFTGQTGVGKTELACALAIEFFGSKESLIRLDMSEYMERHNVARLFGSPPGYIGSLNGGQLTKAIRKNRSSVVLFDEIENAHCDVWNALLQILDYGVMTDGTGQRVDFRGAIIIMTSNIGQRAVIEGIPGGDEAAAKVKVMGELQGSFKPEFLNRIDEIVIFRPLKPEQVRNILEIMVRKLAERVRSAKGIELEVTEELKEKVAVHGYNPSYGARPLKRAIMRLVGDPLADAILDGRVGKGGRITLSSGGCHVVAAKQATIAAKQATTAAEQATTAAKQAITASKQATTAAKQATGVVVLHGGGVARGSGGEIWVLCSICTIIIILSIWVCFSF